MVTPCFHNSLSDPFLHKGYQRSKDTVARGVIFTKVVMTSLTIFLVLFIKTYVFAETFDIDDRKQCGT